MDLKHFFHLPLQVNPCRLDPCVNHCFFVLPLTKTTLGVWKIEEAIQKAQEKSKAQPIELNGHTKTITALAFTTGSSPQLASVCGEKILLWDIDSSEIKSKLFFSNPGDSTVIEFDKSCKFAAGGNGPQILIMESGKSKAKGVLDKHNAMVTCLKFCPHYSATLVSISDDRTCCVWDIKDCVLLYQSSVLSSAPLLSMNMSLVNPCVAIGSGDGKLIVFDLTSGHDFRQLSNIDIAGAISKINEKQISAGRKEDRKEIFAQASESILSVEYTYFCQSSESFQNFSGQSVSGASEILKDIPPSLNIITTNFLVQINSRTLEILNVIPLQESINSESFTSSLIVGSLSYAAAKQINPLQMLVIAGTLFDRKIHVMEWSLMMEKFKSLTVENVNNNVAESNISVDGACELSIVATNPIETNSPLKSEMLPPVIKSATTKGDIATGKKKPSSKMNQPLTFKSTIKSSGYSQAPRTTMFKPETSKEKLLNLHSRVKKSDSKKAGVGKMLKSNNEDTQWDVKDYIDTFEVDSQSCAVFNLRFSDDGTALACALSNKTAVVVKSPFNKHISSSLIGHNHLINTVYWSTCSSYLLTASNDKTVRLWDKSGGDPYMVMTHKNNSPKEGQDNQISVKKSSTLKPAGSIDKSSDKCATVSVDNKLFSKEIIQAQFYYMDKFILLTHGSQLSLYKYHVSQEIDDLKRYHSRNRYKVVGNWDTLSSSFTSSTAVNNFFSHLVLCTTSGKTIEIYDLNRSELAHTFTDCHSRAPHGIVLNQGSCFSSQSTHAYNVFATIAPTDPVKLWDLRSKSCVQALVGHMNKAHACQISFSPCGNYLACGSEDRSVFVYDLRTGTFCEKLKGSTDVVLSVAYNPSKILLAAGSLDSKVLWYK